MRIFKKQNVFDAALERIRYLHSEFATVGVWMSGGKDSTVSLNLTLRIAEELGRLPVPVFFLDQEAEWTAVIEYMRRLKADPRIDLRWYQVPVKIENAASTTDHYLITWEDGKEWMRPAEPDSIRENVYGTDNFYDMFNAIPKHDYPKTPIAIIGGVRTEESPGRFTGLTSYPTYKHVTWGKVLDKANKQFTFYPIYDWSYTDVWKAIHSEGWDYCKIYDLMYQYGYAVQDMRVSSLHHETSIKHAFYMQEIDREVYNALTRRLGGINAVGHLGSEEYLMPKRVPPMFSGWREYRDFLLEKLITDPEDFATLRAKFDQMDKKLLNFPDPDVILKQHVAAIMVNDTWLTKLANWAASPQIGTWESWRRGKPVPANRIKINKYIQMDIKRGELPNATRRTETGSY